MVDLILEGERYRAMFQNSEQRGDHSTHTYSCWKTRPHMWWEGRVKIEDRGNRRDIRAFFETYHRSDALGGIRDESLEESLLLVRGHDDDRGYFNLRIGEEAIPEKVRAIDYLLGRMYEDALELGRDEVFPKIRIPLLEQQELVDLGLVLGETVSV